MLRFVDMKFYRIKYLPSVIIIYLTKLIGIIISPFFVNKKIWLICERGDDARDNGYFFFKYLCENVKGIDFIYLIKKNSPDYNRVKSIGKVIHYGSVKHLIYLHLAKCFISSHNTAIFPNHIIKALIQGGLLRYKAKNVFLQHGVIKDLIVGLVYPKTKLDLFICGAKPEYEFVKKEFNHPKDVVKYTGLARFDNLHELKIKKQVLLMPTWRKWLSNITQEEFMSSDYFIKYSNLLEKINNLLEKTEYTLIFYPHYEIQKYIQCFKGYNKVIIADFANYDVQTLLIESALLITDFSSVFFDFAYMKKPVIYYQFDKEKFFNGHYNKGYFDYETMGFGECTDNEDYLIDLVKKYQDSDCKMPEKYLMRTKEFFPLYDTNNCERIFKEIMEVVKK